jgi:hypothetical protein
MATSYDLSLDELQAETCLALPERDLMQVTVGNVVGGAGGGNAGASVFSEGVGQNVIVILDLTP